jgi:hypothetical protein
MSEAVFGRTDLLFSLIAQQSKAEWAANAALHLALTLASVVVFGLLTFVIIRLIATDELDIAPGVALIGSMLVTMVLLIYAKSAVLSGIVLLGSLAAAAFVPYAKTQMDNQLLDSIPLEALEKAHLSLTGKPDNPSAWFQAARALHGMGLPGHAIVIAELTLGSISDEIDPNTNVSTRSYFQREATMIKYWKEELKDETAFDPVPCPTCHIPNQAGTIKCVKCGGPYLLELARKTFSKKQVWSRLVLGYALCFLVMAACGFLSLVVSGSMMYVVLFGGLAVAGVSLWLMFRTRTLGGTRSDQY